MKSSFVHLRRATPLTVAMTPMIDVVFLLFVFFVCTASFQIPEEDLAASLLVETTAVGAASPLDSLPELDEVTLEGRRLANTVVWSVNQGPEATDHAQLVELLREIAEIDRGVPVTIDPATDVPLSEVVRAYDASRLAGFVTVRLAASAHSIE